MLVKCRGCGNKIERDTAFAVRKGKINTYYCSDSEYMRIAAEKAQAQEQRERLQEIIDDIFNEPVVNTALYKEESEWLKIKPYDTLLEYLKENKSYIETALSRKDFDTQYGKIRYFSAIVKNNLVSYTVPKPDTIKENSVEVYETKYKAKPKRKCLADFKEDD